MKIVFAPEALEELEGTVGYFETSDPAAARRLADRIFTVVGLLAEGVLDGPESRLRSGERVRSWPVPPVRVYYQRVGETLVILRVFHQARRPIASPLRSPRKQKPR